MSCAVIVLSVVGIASPWHERIQHDLAAARLMREGRRR
jgi:hypothetical protein